MLQLHKITLLFGITCLAAVACRKKDTTEKPAPILYKMAPVSASYDEQITLYGKYLQTGASPAVQINGVAANVVATTDTTIIIKVPKGAGSGIITVTNGIHNLSWPGFKYVYKVTVTTVAGPKNNQPGYTNGQGENVRFKSPNGIAVDNNDNVYITDRDNYCIRKMDVNGTVSLLAGVPGTPGYIDAPNGVNARFNTPHGFCNDKNNNMYLIDPQPRKVRKITAGGAVSTIAGNGVFVADEPDGPDALQVPLSVGFSSTTDAAGNVYISNAETTIRKIVPGGGITTIAGTRYQPGYADGQGAAARFRKPGIFACDNQDNIYVYDYDNHRIRKISPSYQVSTFAGSNLDIPFDHDQPLEAGFSIISAMAFDKKGNLLVAESTTGLIRIITPAGSVSTIIKSTRTGVQDGDANTASFGGITGMAINSRNEILITDAHHCIRKVVYE